MTCKEYDKIIKDFDNAIYALFMIKNSHYIITSTIKDLKINIDQTIYELERQKRMFIGTNKRGEK